MLERASSATSSAIAAIFDVKIVRPLKLQLGQSARRHNKRALNIGNGVVLFTTDPCHLAPVAACGVVTKTENGRVGSNRKTFEEIARELIIIALDGCQCSPFGELDILRRCSKALPRKFKSSGQIVEGEVCHHQVAAECGVLWTHNAFRGASRVPLLA